MHFLLPPSFSHYEVLPHPTLMLGVTLLSLHLHSSPPSASILVRGESIVLLTEDLFSGAIICCSLIQFLSFNLFPGINISLLQPPRSLIAVPTTMQPYRQHTHSALTARVHISNIDNVWRMYQKKNAVWKNEASGESHKISVITENTCYRIQDKRMEH